MAVRREFLPTCWRSPSTKLSPVPVCSHIINPVPRMGMGSRPSRVCAQDLAAALATGHAEEVDADAGGLESNDLWAVRGEPG